MENQQRKIGVLIADDHPAPRKTVEFFLRNHPLVSDLVAVEKGMEAYRLISDDPDRFDLLITDVNMPPYHGPELVNDLRTRLGCNIKVIIMTADIGNRIRELLIEVLRDERTLGFISKPFGKEVMRAAATVFTEHDVSRREAENILATETRDSCLMFGLPVPERFKDSGVKV